MTPRTFAIPSTLVSLSLLTGCTPLIVGTWNIEEWKIDGDELDLNYTYQGYEVSRTVTMDIDEDLTGEFEVETTVEGYGSDSISGDVEVEQLTALDFAVNIDVDGDELDLECTVDVDTMDCEGEDEDGTDFDMVWSLEE